MRFQQWFPFIVCLHLFQPVNGAELPDLTIPNGVGVNIHFVTGHQQDLDLIAAAGFKFIRMDFAWEATEPEKGKYQWSGYEELLKNLEKRGVRALFILDYSHHLYEAKVTSPHPITGASQENIASPQHSESIEAFARWAAAAASHFHGHHIIWEIWNEPNGNFWSPKPDAQQYSKLALAAAKAIRQADPNATIVGPASSGFPWDFLQHFLESGVLEYLNAITVHPYRDSRKPPETAGEDYHRLRGMIDKYAPAGKKELPILSGEWGYSSHRHGVTLDTQAAFAARQQLFNLSEHIPLSIWYDWKNDGEDPNENEHNFGTVGHDLKPKPAYTALQNLTRQLGGFRIAERLHVDSEKDYILRCTNSSGKTRLAAWTINTAHSVTFRPPGAVPNNVQGVTAFGEKFAIEMKSNELQLEIGPLPKYLDLNLTPGGR